MADARHPMVALGSRWTLDLEGLGDEERDAVARRWSRCLALADDARALVLDEEPTPIAVTAGSDPYDFSRELTRQGITRLRGRALLFHAAALSDEEGRTAVLVAPSGTGKSTASVRLGRHLGYLTDESVVVDDEDRVAPYPKPPSVITDTEKIWEKEERSPDDHGMGPTPPFGRLATVLVLERSAEPIEAQVNPTPLIELMLRAIPETSSLSWMDRPLDRLAEVVSIGAGPAVLRYHEIEDAVGLIRERLVAPDAPTPWVRHAPGPEQVQPRDQPPTKVEADLESDRPDGPDLEVVRAPWTDAVEADGEVLLLIGNQPVRLGGVGAALWTAAPSPITVRALVDAVVEALGPHPEAEALVAEAARELVRAGVLRAPHLADGGAPTPLAGGQ